MTTKLVRVHTRNAQKGFTLLEYCSGAAIILGVVWIAMSQLGTSMSSLIGSITTWTQSRTTEISNSK